MSLPRILLNIVPILTISGTIAGFTYMGVKTQSEINTKTLTETSSKSVTSISTGGTSNRFSTSTTTKGVDMTNFMETTTTPIEDNAVEEDILCMDDILMEEENADVSLDTDIDWSSLDCELPTMEGTDTIYVEEEILDYIYDISNKYDVPCGLTLSVCYVESGFQPDVNNAGLNSDGTVDYGLMGLNDKYLPYNCDLYNNGELIDPYNAYDNISIGVQILRSNLNTFGGSLYDAACAYNLGPAGWKTKKDAGQGWYYGDKVLAYMNLLEDSLLIS